MMGTRFKARSILFGCVTGLVCVLAIGGLLAAAAEGVPYPDGVWLVFNVVTTTGYGRPPATGWGQLVAGGSFLVAAVCWFGIVSVAVELGLSRFERNTLVREALRPLARRPRTRLFHDN